jgi:CelD/BcsL family acetyltransferase involved in cellulose biosynthesis
MSTGPLTSEIIGDSQALTSLLGEWWQLWRQCKTATPFQSPAWLLPWWRAFAPGELCVVVVRRGGRLVGLAPCYVEATSVERRVLPLGVSVSDYLDILIDPEAPKATRSALVRQLAGAAWDRCEWVELEPQACALALPCPPGCLDTIKTAQSCPVLPLPANPEQLFRVIPKGQRRDVRQSQNRLARRGRLCIVRPQAASARQLLAELVRLHQARWESRGQRGVLSDQRVISFQHAAVSDLLAAGLVRFYLLELSGAVAAIYYGFMHANRAYAYLGGFDPAFAFESPGTVLLDHAIREAVREGAQEFCFLRGQEAYKYRWGAVDRWNYHRSFRRTYGRQC